jgi:hypothetical protein
LIQSSRRFTIISKPKDDEQFGYPDYAKERGLRGKNPPHKIISITHIAVIFVFFLFSITYLISEEKEFSLEDAHQILNTICREVMEFGKYDDEDFTKREFFIDLDKNEVNKEEHVVVLHRQTGDKEQMTVQVTYFEPKKINRLIKLAKTTKEILCRFQKGKIEITECDYQINEIQTLLPRILEGIKNKKKLLKLIHNKKKTVAPD